MFRTIPLSIIRSFSLYTQQWYMSYWFADSLRAGSGWNSILILLTSFQPELYTIQTIPLSIIRRFSLYTQQWYMSYRFCWHLHQFLKFIFEIELHMFRIVPLSIMRSFFTVHTAGSGRNCSSVLILLASCQQTCMTYTIAVCTVKNSWWWTEELSETCRVLFQK